MIILENVLLDELLEIFNENNQQYVSDKASIFDKTFLKVVAVENGYAIGYMVLYFGDDFIQKEKYPLKYPVEKNSAYIWHCITKKGYEGKGVQSTIFEYILKKYNKFNFYSVVDVSNMPSLHLHKNFNFKIVANFDKEYDGEMCSYNLMKHYKRLKNGK